MLTRLLQMGVSLALMASLSFGCASISHASEAEDWFQKGNLYHKAGQLMNAIDAYSRSIEFDATFWVAHYNLGLAYKKTRQYPKAVDALQKALGLVPNNLDIHVSLGNVYNFMEKWEPAIQHLNLVVHRRQGDPVAHGNLGWALYNYQRGPKFKLLVVLNLKQAINLFEQQNQKEAAEATRKTLEEVLSDLNLDKTGPESLL